LNSPRSKRWNGSIDTLPVDYLNGVIVKMADYGDRVQLSLISGGPQPSYQVMNNLDKKMAFDRNHHLLHPQEDEFAGANATPFYTLEQIKAAISGLGIRSSGGTRTVRVTRAASGGTRTSAAKLTEQLAARRYEYFKEHRQSLPPTISKYSEEIMELMKTNISVEDAFSTVVKKYF
jgi:hypothetical protein